MGSISRMRTATASFSHQRPSAILLCRIMTPPFCLPNSEGAILLSLFRIVSKSLRSQFFFGHNPFYIHNIYVRERLKILHWTFKFKNHYITHNIFHTNTWSHTKYSHNTERPIHSGKRWVQLQMIPKMAPEWLLRIHGASAHIGFHIAFCTWAWSPICLNIPEINKTSVFYVLLLENQICWTFAFSSRLETLSPVSELVPEGDPTIFPNRQEYFL